MSEFQKQAYTTFALGKEGTVSRIHEPSVKLPYLAEGNTVKSGGFVFYGTNAETQVVGVKTGATVADIAGFCELAYYQVALQAGTNSLTVNPGQEVAVRKTGFMFARPTTASVKGQGVFVNPTNGEIQTATTAPTDFLDTGWKVETGNTAGNVCEISKY